MNQEQRLDYILEYLCNERSGEIQIPNSFTPKRDLFRCLVNVRPSRPISDEFIVVQDEFLQEESRQRGIVHLTDIPPCTSDGRISLWQGDITRLVVDAIANAANSKLLGCFIPNHSCIDNTIHTFAGVQLRQACYDIMQKQEHDEDTGTAKITPAFNLPCRYVLHTVGPIVENELNKRHIHQLEQCYVSCLELASKHGHRSIAFCCISTGVYRFPKVEAAQIAVNEVRKYLNENRNIERVVFNVFTNEDYKLCSSIV